MEGTQTERVASVLHPDQDEKNIQVFHILQLVDENGNIADIMVGGGLRDHHIRPVDMIPGCRLDEVIQEKDLIRRQLLGD